MYRVNFRKLLGHVVLVALCGIGVAGAVKGDDANNPRKRSRQVFEGSNDPEYVAPLDFTKRFRSDRAISLIDRLDIRTAFKIFETIDRESILYKELTELDNPGGDWDLDRKRFARYRGALEEWKNLDAGAALLSFFKNQSEVGGGLSLRQKVIIELRQKELINGLNIHETWETFNALTDEQKKKIGPLIATYEPLEENFPSTKNEFYGNLKYMTHLERLELVDVDITGHDASKLAMYFLSTKNLKYLRLNNGKMNQMAPVLFSRGLAQTRTLEDLTLRVMDISDHGIIALSNGLIHNKSVKNLDLGNNSFTDFGLGMFAHMLTLNTTLETLDLSFNEIGDAGGKVLLDALKTQKRLFPQAGIRRITLWHRDDVSSIQANMFTEAFKNTFRVFCRENHIELDEQ